MGGHGRASGDVGLAGPANLEGAHIIQEVDHFHMAA